jgi:hypothetical protein
MASDNGSAIMYMLNVKKPDQSTRENIESTGHQRTFSHRGVEQIVRAAEEIFEMTKGLTKDDLGKLLTVAAFIFGGWLRFHSPQSCICST